MWDGFVRLFVGKYGARVTGIDISEVALDLGKARARDQGVEDVMFLVMDAEKMQFEDNSFDLVCGTSILHHLHLSKALRELARILKPQEKAIFIEPIGHNPAINLFRRLTSHFTLFAGAGKSEKAGSSLNMANYGLLLRTGAVFKNLWFFIGAGIANGKLNLNGDKYTFDSYLLKTGLKLKLGMLELGGGYNYFPQEWKGNSAVEKDIDSSGVYGYIGLCYEIK